MPPTIIDAKPHVGQASVHKHPARYKVLNCGRRWGKTRLGVLECLDVASRGGRAWWVAPTYKVSEYGWRPLVRICSQIDRVTIRRSDRHVTLPGGGWVAVRSADKPDSLRGEGLDFVVIDEAAFVQEDAWTHALRPALSDRRGSALFISTPKGRNWFWRLYQHAQRHHDEWAAWTFKTTDNPVMDPNEIEAARAELPDRIFRQEYLAEFIDDAGGVFRGVMECANAQPQSEAVADHSYIFGVDWGKVDDFTVIVVLDVKERSVVAMDRFNQIDYALQRQRLMALAERFRPVAIFAEANAMGEPIIEQLRRDGLPVKPFYTVAGTKAAAIEALALAFERRDIRILNEPVLVNELQAYEINKTARGNTTYGAPSGLHDDTVMALAIGWTAFGPRLQVR